MKKSLVVSSSPHIWARTSTSSVMRDVAIALLPALVASCYFFGWQALILTLVCVISCVGFEFLYRLMMKLPQTIDDFSAIVTGMLLAFVLPASAPFWIGIIGSFVAIVIVKQIFGGLGKNFANPAAVGRIFLMLAFAAKMATVVTPIRPEPIEIFSVETVSGATEQVAATEDTASIATEQATTAEDITSGATEQVATTEDTTSTATEQTTAVEDTTSAATEQTTAVEDTTSAATEQATVVEDTTSAATEQATTTEDTASIATEQAAATEDTTSSATDTVSAASPLAVAQQETKPTYLDLFLGRNIAGALGETCKLALLLGALYLVIRKVITPTIPLAFIATAFVFSWVFGMDPLYQILSGGLILGACFMATDYATSPITMTGQIIFGIGCGLLTVVLRKFSSMTEGVIYAIVFMNLLTPLIDRLCKTTPFGSGEKSEVKTA